MIVSLFRTVVNPEDIENPAHVDVTKVLEGIKNGKWKDQITALRSRTTKSDQEALKKKLPAALFGGKFKARRLDGFLESSNIVTLDFDYLTPEKADNVKKILESKPYILAHFKSPRGGGLKALARGSFQDPEQYKSVYWALDDDLGQLESFDLGTNDISRACFMSYDPDMYINPNAEEFEGYIDDYEAYSKQRRLVSPEKTFQYLLKWMKNNNREYVEGERNAYLYVLGSAMCRYGIPSNTTEGFFINKFDLSVEEIQQIIASAYKRNEFGSVKMTSLDPHDDNDFYSALTVPDFDFDPEDVIVNMDNTNHDVFEIARGGKKFESFGLRAMDKYLVLKSNEYYAFVAGSKSGKTLHINYLAAWAAKNANWRFIVLTTETDIKEFKALMVSFLINKYISKGTDEEINKALAFIDEHFVFIENDLDHLQLLDVYHYLKTQGYVFDAIILDPLTNVDVSKNIKTPNDNSYYNQLNARYLKFAKKYCALWVISHTNTSKEREKGVPYVQDAEYGVHIARRCHYGITLYRDMYDEMNKNIVELHIRYVRSAITRGGGTTTDENPVKFILDTHGDSFGYDVEVDGIRYKNPLHNDNLAMNPSMPEQDFEPPLETGKGDQKSLNPFTTSQDGGPKEDTPF